MEQKNQNSNKRKSLGGFYSNIKKWNTVNKSSEELKVIIRDMANALRFQSTRIRKLKFVIKKRNSAASDEKKILIKNSKKEISELKKTKIELEKTKISLLESNAKIADLKNSISISEKNAIKFKATKILKVKNDDKRIIDVLENLIITDRFCKKNKITRNELFCLISFQYKHVANANINNMYFYKIKKEGFINYKSISNQNTAFITDKGIEIVNMYKNEIFKNDQKTEKYSNQ